MSQWWIVIGISTVCAVPGVLTGGLSYVTIPLLMSVGLEAHHAVATNKPAILFLGVMGVLGFRKDLRRVPGVYGWLAVVMGIGSLIGAELLLVLPVAWIRWGIILIAVLFVLPFRVPGIPSLRNGPEGDPEPAFSWSGVVGTGLLALYNGMLGPGTVTMLISLFRFRAGLPMRSAIALSHILGLVGNGVAMVRFASAELIHWSYAGGLAAGIAVGAYIGVLLGRRLPVRWMEWLLRGVLVILIVRLLHG